MYFIISRFLQFSDYILSRLAYSIYIFFIKIHINESFYNHINHNKKNCFFLIPDQGFRIINKNPNFLLPVTVA